MVNEVWVSKEAVVEKARIANTYPKADTVATIEANTVALTN